VAVAHQFEEQLVRAFLHADVGEPAVHLCLLVALEQLRIARLQRLGLQSCSDNVASSPESQKGERPASGGWVFSAPGLETHACLAGSDRQPRPRNADP
jgi:hypothetical protein